MAKHKKYRTSWWTRLRTRPGDFEREHYVPRRQRLDTDEGSFSDQVDLDAEAALIAAERDDPGDVYVDELG